MLLIHHFAFSEWPPIQPQAAMEQDVIEISSDEELEDEVKTPMRENNKSLPSKKRTISSSESATGSPSKRQITLNMAIEVQDSDDKHPTAMKAIPSPTKAIPARATAFSDTKDVKVERGTEKISLITSPGNLDEAEKDKLGRYIVTQKVKVDLIENLLEVPARWPILPEGINTAYIIDLNNNKKWQKLDTNSKKKQLDRFIKQEVCPNYYVAETAN